MIAPARFVEIGDPSQVGSARRSAVAVAQSCGMTETESATVGILATELAGNLARHATGGVFVVQPVAAGTRNGIEILSIDRGPGMASVADCLRDGFSTGATPGTGLGAVRRLSSVFDIHSVPGRGTVILSRFTPETTASNGKSVDWGAVCRPVRGETACGDLWRVQRDQDTVTFLVVDGLGHGDRASEAALAVAGSFERHASSAPDQILNAAHREISGTRGAAASIARLDCRSGQIRFAGIGNVTSTLFAGGISKGMVAHNGTLGVQVRKFHALDYEWPANGLLVMHSDGLSSRWSLAEYPGLQMRHPSVIAAVLARDFARTTDDVTVLVARREN